MPNTYELAGKSAIVTGGAKGIGRAVVDRLLVSGAAVWVWDVSAVEVQGAKSAIVDSTQPAQIAACLAQLDEDSRIVGRQGRSRQHNILVNCVAPGPIDTDMIRDLGPDVVERMIVDSPMKRLGAPDEVAHLVALLCSEASRFNTGAVFDMSGGRARY